MCGDCAGLVAWPCELARRSLLERYDGARESLLVWLRLRLVDACRDSAEPARVLYDRYVGWAVPKARPAGYEWNRAGRFRR